jgi:hypothetical protein
MSSRNSSNPRRCDSVLLLMLSSMNVLVFISSIAIYITYVYACITLAHYHHNLHLKKKLKVTTYTSLLFDKTQVII